VVHFSGLFGFEPVQDIPSIVIDAFPSTLPSTTPDITSASRPGMIYGGQDSPPPAPRDSRSFETPFELDRSVRSSRLQIGHRTAESASGDFSALSVAALDTIV
jgi:hypothetical protein